ncbi:hypothetical protein [Sulfurimonas sp.]|uniref:hypothetical protein n=1 Tax=Sulfurimonas sp. TaxID=2022749 RepID=UPI003565C5C9
MSISKLLLLASVLMVSLNAEDLSCDDKNDVCIEKCEEKENGSEACIKKCEAQNEKCLESEPKPKED